MNTPLQGVLLYPELENDFTSKLREADLGKVLGSRRWIYDDWGEVYIRVTHTSIEGELSPCIVVANVTIRERQRSKGLFKRICRAVERYAADTGKAVVHENIANPRLVAFHVRCGYKPVRHSDAVFPTMYRSANDLRSNPFDWSKENGIEEIQ